MKRTMAEGIVIFLNTEYKDQGGFSRFTELLKFGWPKTVIGREFKNVRRQTVTDWCNQMKKEGLWSPEYESGSEVQNLST